MIESYEVELLPEAYTNLKRLSKSNAQRILDKVKWLSNNFDSVSHEALRGEFKGLFKLRVCEYRVIYSFIREKKLIIIHLVGHRRSIYEKH